MKIKRINLIEGPHKNRTLSMQDMNAIVGGLTCISFDSCKSSKLSSCGSYADAEFCNGSTDISQIKCSVYTFF